MENATQKSRPLSKNARKRKEKRMEKSASVNGEKFRLQLQQLQAEEAVKLVRGLFDEKQRAILAKYEADLQRISRDLHAQAAWDYLEEQREEAEWWGLGDTLKHMVIDAAGKFSDPRQLRLTARHGPR